MIELVKEITNIFENYMLQLENNETCFQTINDEINDLIKMNVFLSEYKKNIDNEADYIKKSNKLKKMIKFVLSYSKLEYIQYLIEKYEFKELKSLYLNLVMKNQNPNVP